MRVVLKADAVCCPEVWSLLDRILHRIEDGAHVWDIEDPDALEGTTWLCHARPSLRELFEDAVKNGAYPIEALHTRRVIVTVDPRLGELTPQQAVRYVAKPLCVLMENRLTDGLLLETVLEFLAPEPLRQLRNRNVPDLILCDGPGGNGEMPKLVEDYALKAAAEGVPLRVVVFADGDGRFPGHVSEKARNIENTCRGHDVPCRILRKRCIESYIPDEVLESWVKAPKNSKYHAQVAAITRLTRDQRDHAPIKKGLQDEEALLRDEKGLYASINPTDRAALRQGLGSRVIEALKTHKTALSTEVLRRRDHSGDLDDLVQMIVKEL